MLIQRIALGAGDDVTPGRAGCGRRAQRARRWALAAPEVAALSGQPGVDVRAEV